MLGLCYLRSIRAKCTALILLASLSVLVAGCRGRESNSSESASRNSNPPTAPQKLRLISIDDSSKLADQLARLWSAERGGEVAVEYLDSAKLEENSDPLKQADVFLYPSLLSGQLSATGLLQTLDRSSGFGESFDQNVLLPLDRFTVVQDGEAVVAVSLGTPLLMLVWRTDVLDALELQPPKTWQEYARVAQKIHDSAQQLKSKDPPLPTEVCEPWSGRWSIEMLLNRALSRSAIRGRLSSFFDVTSLDALIDTPPFVSALDDMLALKPFLTDEAQTPTECYQRVVEGRAAVAVTIVTSQPDVADAVTPLPIAVGPLPLAGRWYDYRNSAWKDDNNVDISRVVVVPVTGRLMSMSKQCLHVRSAMRMLNWLCTKEVHRQLATTMVESAPILATELDQPYDWVNPQLPRSAAEQMVDVTEEYQRRALAISNLRLPHRREYVAALQAAVEAALDGSQTPADALAQCAAKWNELTDKFGRDAMRQQFQKNVGIKY